MIQTASMFQAIVTLSLLSCTFSAYAKDGDSASATVEHVTEKPQRTGGGLGTKLYTPSEKEQPYFRKLAPQERRTGGSGVDYDLSTKNKVYVGWFGIVRQVDERQDENQTVLLVEHKYFDGFTDAHIQALSFNGSGDFIVTVPGVGHKIDRLSLVKVYGVASIYQAKSKPDIKIKADFVRVWHWGTFTFLFASGQQRGSEEWRKLNSVDLDRIYNPYPDDEYYKRRLGEK
jgi:hypothetical protein